MTPEQAAREKSLGGIFVFSAYVLWGFLPLYFVSLAPTTPWEVVGWRILLSLVFCIALLAITRGWGRMRVILRDRRLMLWTLLAGLLIYVNWQVFLIGTLTGHVVETSLGYFINPIATVLLGVIVLKERLRTAQWVAVGIAGVAVVVIIVAVGRVPWIALALAASFATYGLVKKKIGPSVDAVSGLTLEVKGGESPKLLRVLVGGEPLEKERTYRVATNNFLAEGGDNYLLLAEAESVTHDPILLRELLERRFEGDPVTPPTDDRYRVR